MKRGHLENLSIDRRIIMKWIFKMWNWQGLNWILWLGLGQVVSACECGNEPSGSIQCGKFLD